MYRTILFDVDGVLLSEERYFDASALCVWELLGSPQYLGLDLGFTPAPDEPTIRRVRRAVFADDRVLSFIKSRGLNSNWDMVFLTFSFQLLLLLEQLAREDRAFVRDVLSGPIDRDVLQEIGARARGLGFTPQYAAFVDAFAPSPAVKAELLLYLNAIAAQRTGVETAIFSRNSALWELCREAFQEWYLGDRLYEETTGRPPSQAGKRGFLEDEIPLAPPEALRALLRSLRERGIRLGVGTGRPTTETVVPLSALGLLEFFDPNAVVTASDVLAAERAHPDAAPLAKPHPYTYLKALFGKTTPDDAVLRAALPVDGADSVLIVGDSLADLLAARRIGCRFAATLTGLEGAKARETFAEHRADHILNDVTQLVTVLS